MIIPNQMRSIKKTTYPTIGIAMTLLYPATSLAQIRRTLIGDLLINVISTFNMLVTLLFIVALLVFAWGVIRMIIAAGQGPQALQQAKTVLLWGIIGMAVLASISGIVLLVQQFFGVQGNSTMQVPQFSGTSSSNAPPTGSSPTGPGNPPGNPPTGGSNGCAAGEQFCADSNPASPICFGRNGTYTTSPTGGGTCFRASTSNPSGPGAPPSPPQPPT